MAKQDKQDRKDREREEVRQRILDAAAKLVVAEGYDKTSLRAIAAAVQYSPAALYLHFPNKQDIFEALFMRLFAMFSAKLSEANQEPNPLKRLVTLGHKYLAFATENPAYYEVMFIMPHPQLDKTTLNPQQICFPETQLQTESFSHLQNAIIYIVESGYTLLYDVPTANMVAWSMVHGIACLQIRQFTDMFPEEVRASSIENALKSILPAIVKNFNEDADY